MWRLFFAFLTLCFSMGGVQGGGDGGKVMLALRQRNTDILVRMPFTLFRILNLLSMGTIGVKTR